MALDKVTVGVLADDAVTTAKIADSPTLVTPNIGTPSAGVVTNLSGVLPVGGTGGSGLNPVPEVERTSLTSPDTITATCTLADTLDSAGSISADLFGSSSVTLFGGVSQTNAAITFDYGSGVTKYLRYIEWYQVDGAGNNTGIKIRGSDNGTSWTDITTITSAIVNGTTYSFTNTGTTGYRYWQVQYTWSTANRGNVQDFIIHESDVSSVTNLSPATTFPAGHILQVKNDMISSSFAASNSNVIFWTGDTLTLAASSNKVLILGSFYIGGDRGGSVKLQVSTDAGSNYVNITTADMGLNDYYQDGIAVMGWHFNYSVPAANAGFQNSFNYLHTPGNVSAKYRLMLNSGNAYTANINRRNSDDAYGGISWVTYMEVSA